MTMKKKILTTLSVVLILGLAALGILAYLQDDDSDVNVMTLGNVSIEQLEYERALNEDGTYKTATVDDRTSYVLQEFTQEKPLLPSALNTTTWEGWGWDGTPVRNSQIGSYAGMSVFKDAANAQDKFVFVKNTGKTDVYVRTLVAVEVGTSTFDMFGTNAHLGAWNETEIGTITVDGNNYYVLEYVYNGMTLADGTYKHENGILPAGDISINNFAQIYLHSKATNEDMEAIDGNGNGTLDILVLSQAGQVAGFESVGAASALDTMFGESSEKAAEWFDGVWADYNSVAFAVYCEEDGSLTFDRAETVPAVGDTYNNKTVTAVFTGVETTNYQTHAGNAPAWKKYAKYITSVDFEAKISPISTASWFEGMLNLTAITDLKLLDTSDVTNMEAMFCNCQKLTSLNLSTFDTANVTNMINMFASCVEMESMTLTDDFVTSKVESVNSMFYACGNNVDSFRLDCSHWDVSGVQHSGGVSGQASWCKGCVFFDVFVEDKVIEPDFNCPVE